MEKQSDVACFSQGKDISCESGTDIINPLDQQYQLALTNYWYRQWICVCHVSELPDKGMYLTVNIGDFPLVITRDETAGNLHVLNNSCRHRGSRVCQMQKGSAAKLVCPYHQWTYALDGSLIYARFMEQEVDLSRYPLKTIVHKIIDGFIYVQLLPLESANLVPSQAQDDNSISSLENVANYEVLYEFHHTQNEDINTVLASLGLAADLTSKTSSKMGNMVIFDCAEKGHLLIKVFPKSRHFTQLVIQWMTPKSISHFSKKDFINTIQQHYPLEDMDEQDIAQVNQPVASETDGAAHKLSLAGAIDPYVFYSPERLWVAESETLICSMIIDETHNVKTFTFRTLNGSWFNYKPGQFITLSLPVADDPLLRTYTLVSSPSRPTSISITVKLQPDGGRGGTKWLFENLKVGDQLKAYGPNGQFSFFDKPAEKYLFLSAGSGITPMMSMVRWMYDYGVAIDMNLVACFACPDDILFRTELERMSRRAKHLQLAWVCQEDETNSWTGYRGYFNKLMLGLTTPDYMERDIYCCGPEPFMQAVREILHDSGFDMSRYYEESFFAQTDGEPRATAHHDWLPDAHKTVNLQFTNSGKATQAAQTDTLLEIAKTQHIAIPSACGIGVCGTCKVKVTRGEAHMVHNGGISQKEIDEQCVLACCTYPLTDLDIEI